MHNVFALKLNVASKNLLHILEGLALSQRLFNALAHVSMTKLCHQICVVLGGEHIMEEEDVG